MQKSAHKDQSRVESQGSGASTAMDGPASSFLARAQEIMNRAPSVAAHAELQDRLNRGASAPVVQAMRIESLGLDTDEVDDSKLIAALKSRWSSILGLAVQLSPAEAKYLYERLKTSGLNPDILEALQEKAEPDSGSESEEEDEKEKEKPLSAEEAAALFATPDLDLDFGAPSASRPAVDKVATARKVLNVLKLEGGLPVFLAGGGAVTLAGGPRAIKDLDLRIDLDPVRTFAAADPLSQGLIDGINRILGGNFDDVDPLERADPETGFTISGKVDGVEVSITRTPLVENLGRGVDPQGIERLGDFDLLLDKAYSFTVRSNFEKQVTDLIDILSLIDQQPGLVAVFRGLNQLRGPAFASQAQRINRRSGAARGNNLLVEFRSSLHELLDGYGPQVQRLMKEDGAGALYPRAAWLLEQLERIPEAATVKVV